MIGYFIIVLAGFGWIVYFNPEWLTNHWRHWLFW